MILGLALTAACAEDDQDRSVLRGAHQLTTRRDLDILRGVKRIDGFVSIQGPDISGTLELPELEESSDVLEIKDTLLTRIALPKLAHANNLSIEDNSALEELDLSQLRELYWLDAYGSPRLSALELAALNSAGRLEFFQGLERLSLPQLESITVGLELRDMPNLSSLNLPVLRSADSLYLTGLDALAAIELPALNSVRHAAYFRGEMLASLSLPQLRFADDLSLRGPLQELELCALEIAHSLSVEAADLSRLELGQLRQAGSLSIFGSQAGPQIALPALEHLGDLHLYEGGLGELSLPVLVDAGAVAALDVTLRGLSAPQLVQVGEISVSSTTLSALELPRLARAGTISIAAAALGCEQEPLFPALEDRRGSVLLNRTQCP